MSRTKIVGALVLSLLAIAFVAQEKSAPRSKFVLSSPDAQLTAKVPEVYTANVFAVFHPARKPVESAYQ